MQITLKKMISPENKIVKAFGTDTLTYDCYLLNNTSALTISLELVTDFATISKYNYIDVPTLGRKYFIRDITSLDGERVQIIAQTDVISSFADDVLSAQILTDRATSEPNVFIPDNYLHNSTRGITQIKLFSGAEWLSTPTASSNSVVISTFGGE